MQETEMGWEGKVVPLYTCGQKRLSIKTTFNEDWRERICKPCGPLQEEYCGLQK